jgi:hypothetical protein
MWSQHALIHTYICEPTCIHTYICEPHAYRQTFCSCAQHMHTRKQTQSHKPTLSCALHVHTHIIIISIIITCNRARSNTIPQPYIIMHLARTYIHTHDHHHMQQGSERANILFDLRKEPDSKPSPEVKSVSICPSRPHLMAAACKDTLVRVWDRYACPQMPHVYVQRRCINTQTLAFFFGYDSSRDRLNLN